MKRDVAGRLELVSLGWAAGIQVGDVPDVMAERLESRWRSLALPAMAPAPLRATIDARCVDGSIGLAGESLLVEVSLSWTDERRATLRAIAVEGEIELGPASVAFRGRIEAARARGALEAILRAVAALSLARRHVLLLHASAVANAEGALLFLGASGAGKTTTARRLGREGFQRLADDMIAIDVADDPPRLHLLPFERMGRWAPAARLLPPPVPCVAAALVQKGLPAAVDPSPETVRAWADARLALPCAPGEERAALDDFCRLCAVPVFRIAVPPRGPISALAHLVFQESARKRLDGGGPLGHPANPTTTSRPLMPGLESFSDTLLLQRAPNVAWRVLDGHAVLVAPSSPLVHTLNAVGTLVWELADGRPVSSILDAVVNEFAVTRTQAKADVELFVRDLLNKHLLTVAEAA